MTWGWERYFETVKIWTSRPVFQEECHHSYDKKCHTSYSTEYESQQEEECDDNYKKECEITYSPHATNVSVAVCMTPLIKVGANVQQETINLFPIICLGKINILLHKIEGILIYPGLFHQK